MTQEVTDGDPSKHDNFGAKWGDRPGHREDTPNTPDTRNFNAGLLISVILRPVN